MDSTPHILSKIYFLRVFPCESVASMVITNAFLPLHTQNILYTCFLSLVTLVMQQPPFKHHHPKTGFTIYAIPLAEFSRKFGLRQLVKSDSTNQPSE